MERTSRRVEHDRLVYYSVKADADFWDVIWRSRLSADYYAAPNRADLGWFEDVFLRYLPKSGRILEAGCGPGHHVVALRLRGYDVEGIEWGRKTVEAVKSLFPDIPIKVGDAMHLAVPDGHYDGYIALGVFEHRRAGPEPFLSEARRVLKPDGVALISVPCFNALRRLKARLGLYGGDIQGLEFYQYAFTASEFVNLLEAAGLAVIDRMGYDSYKSFVDEIGLLRKLFVRTVNGRDIGALIQRALRKVGFVEHAFGHMVLFVCRAT